ncbi:hypothetical protein AVEN_8425-1 [Araneus ventricosus]|uniref:HTH CENPB-type domain-containing protein n=1 Tax=Araneus ventricosus TaxID=182803 RepID=A0A4Y2QPK6_ARAVE|nr:hypothetical protein AVEN_8425-1 [Araneus ventricosus]
MGKDDFLASEGWFRRWKKRENITSVKPLAEQGYAYQVAAKAWIAENLPSAVFNADETGLCYRTLPEDTYVSKGEKIKGAKTCKARLTVLCCVSMSGENCWTSVKVKKRDVLKGVKNYQSNTKQIPMRG